MCNSAYTLSAWIKPITTSSSSAWGIAGWGNYGTTRQANALHQRGERVQHYWWNADLVPTNAQVNALGVTLSNTAIRPLTGPKITNITVNGVTANYLTIFFNRWSDADDLTYHVEFRRM